MNEFNPKWRSPPGDTIKDLIERDGIGRVTLGARLFLSRVELDDLLEGRLPLTEELADRLALVFGTSAQFWINREAHYREPLDA